MRTIKFEVPGACHGKGRPRFARQGNFVRAYTDKETMNYELWVKQQFINTGELGFLNEEPLGCTIEVLCEIPKSVSKKKRQGMILNLIKPTKKPDCDNIAKSVLDGLNKTAYMDDTQIVELIVKKRYTDGVPTVFITLEELSLL